MNFPKILGKNCFKAILLVLVFILFSCVLLLGCCSDSSRLIHSGIVTSFNISGISRECWGKGTVIFNDGATFSGAPWRPALVYIGKNYTLYYGCKDGTWQFWLELTEK